MWSDAQQMQPFCLQARPSSAREGEKRDDRETPCMLILRRWGVLFPTSYSCCCRADRGPGPASCVNYAISTCLTLSPDKRGEKCMTDRRSNGAVVTYELYLYNVQSGGEGGWQTAQQRSKFSGKKNPFVVDVTWALPTRHTVNVW